MLHKVDQEFLEICTKITQEAKTVSEWRSTEASDTFQTQHYCGGFDSIEDAFCFSYYDDQSAEYWFQLSLEDIQKVASLEIKEILLRKQA